MKKILLFVFVVAIVLCSCTSRSRHHEQMAYKDFCKNWTPISDPSGKMLGIIAFENYLKSKGYLGKGMPIDYINFINDTQQIFIPENTPDFELMRCALWSESAGAPDIHILTNPIEENIIANMNKLNPDDVLFRFGKCFEELKQSNNARHIFKDFYSNLTKEEFDRPLIKTMYYIVYQARENGTKKIIFEYKYKQINKPKASLKESPPEEVVKTKQINLNEINVSGNEVKDAPLTVAEQMPEFPGGNDELNKFITNNIKYPKAVKEDGTTGTVYITFVVDKTGKISQPKILRGIGNGCDEEAIRIVRKMPLWKPGKQNGKTVAVQYNLPIHFKLN